MTDNLVKNQGFISGVPIMTNTSLGCNLNVVSHSVHGQNSSLIQARPRGLKNEQVPLAQGQHRGNQSASLLLAPPSVSKCVSVPGDADFEPSEPVQGLQIDGIDHRDSQANTAERGSRADYVCAQILSSQQDRNLASGVEKNLDRADRLANRERELKFDLARI